MPTGRGLGDDSQMPAPLDPITWALVSTLFDTGCELQPDERERWLAQLDQAQPALAPWLRRLLQAHDLRSEDDWLERGPRLDALEASAALGECGLVAGARVGPWLLRVPLGSGGMATVWRAVRADASLAREVALKLPLAQRAGFDLAERFRREQDILSRLEHPNIARLYDAGVAEDGTPWLAMECVDGQRIDAWCDARRLDIRGRIALFAQVLAALQYAHARLVIHRDLKPSNILVDAHGQVRLLDFGIARLIADDPAVPAPALTQAAQRLMTPAYAAPEQVRGEPLTTAADQYALGVVLFELLTGRSPYRQLIGSAAQLELAIAAADVQRASAVPNEAAAATRSGNLRTLRRDLAGDLDTVLARALALDPVRRYASAAAFADDLARHLAGLPVAAQADSFWYRLRKLVVRKRWQTAAVGAVVLSTAAGVGVALWQAGVARQERNAALAETERSSSINFFFADLLEDAAQSPQPINGDQLVARAEMLARREFKTNPDALAAVLLSIGTLHQSHGRRAESRRVVEEAFAIARDPAFRDDVACALAPMLGDHARATAMLSAVADQEGRGAGSHTACLVYLGDLLRTTDPQRALQRYRQAMADWEQSATRSPHDQITIMGRSAYASALLGHTAEAVRGFERALQLADTLGRGEAAMGIALRNRLGRVWLMAGQPARALPLFEHNLAEQARNRTETELPADTLINQGQALIDIGQPDKALAPLRKAAAAASAGGSVALRAQAQCLWRWAAALDAQTMAGAGDAAPADAISRTVCSLAQAQVLRSQAAWAPLLAHLAKTAGDIAPEPQWAVDALLLRTQAQIGLGQLDAAAGLARTALDEARRLQDGAPDSQRARDALALLARSQH
jgi:tetratricopeptide (TPR) repeat protein